MSKFVFVEKLSELPWWVGPKWVSIYIGRKSDHDKYEMRKWIEENCEHEVAVFGRTRWPKTGESNWTSVISGDGTADVYFEDRKEAAMFKLAWGVEELPINQRVYR